MKAQAHTTTLQSLLPLSAICRASNADIPVKVVEDLGGGSDGKHYVRFTSDVEGYNEGRVLTDQIEPSNPRDAALWYAVAFGWSVVPLHGVDAPGCTCGKENCASPGKHPRTKNGLKDATTDPKTI